MVRDMYMIMMLKMVLVGRIIFLMGWNVRNFMILLIVGLSEN